jgi:hypothetical protein
VTTLRAVDPECVDLATSAPEAARGTCHDPASVVAEKDPELLLSTYANSCDRGGRELLLEQRQIARIGVILDDEVMWAAHERLRVTD